MEKTQGEIKLEAHPVPPNGVGDQPSAALSLSWPWSDC